MKISTRSVSLFLFTLLYRFYCTDSVCLHPEIGESSQIGALGVYVNWTKRPIWKTKISGRHNEFKKSKRAIKGC